MTNKGIGGYFELELSDRGGFLHDDGVLLNSGRNALEYALRALGDVKSLLVPYYTCDVVMEPIEKLGVPYTFYSINPKLEIEDLPSLKNGEYLIYTNYATIYKQVFLNFHKERKDFSKANVFAFLKRKYLDKAFSGIVWNDNTINKDISMLIRMYVTPDTNIYEDYSSILLDLNLIKRIEKEVYEFNYTTKSKTNPLIFFYAVHKLSGGSQVVEFEKMLDLSLLFCLSQNELYDIFNQLTAINSNITFDNSAGEQLFAVKQDFDEFEILNMYYKSK